MTRKCIVLGNSVALRVRGGNCKKNYSDILTESGLYCKNIGKAGTLITEAFLYLDDEIICEKYDYIIINFGIVEIYSRNIFRGFNNLFVHNKYNNSVLGKKYVSKKKIKFINCLKPILLFFYFLKKITRHDYTWLSVNSYIESLNEIISIIKKETNSKIILIGLHEIDSTKEVKFTNINKRVRHINSYYESLSNKQDIYYIDIESNMKNDRSIKSPDGIHYSDVFHHHVFNLLKNCME